MWFKWVQIVLQVKLWNNNNIQIKETSIYILAKSWILFIFLQNFCLYILEGSFSYKNDIHEISTNF